MTITINIRNYVLLGTIISASATAPAQAGSLKNLNSNDDLAKSPNKQASVNSKDIFLVEKQNCQEADPCISFPEFDLDGEFNENDKTYSSKKPSKKKARQITQSVKATKNVEIKHLADGRKAIIYKNQFTPSESEQLHTSVYLSAASERKKVPEPSALIGLITFFFLAAKRQTAKNSPRLIE
ncbi:hypothetical protein [Calothrix sp. CCY 0018]|uniref:hypothetical protein n=1 Tax=Calothrix sp. CCY 0018 TaxID=3103864 RepID=UPI0039C5DE10